MLHRLSPLIVATFALAACSTAPRVTTSQPVAESVDTPYRNILVIALFESQDSRWSFEREVVKQLSEAGTHAAGSLSLEDSDTDVTKKTVLAMVEEFDADAVLVTQVASLNSKMKMKDMRPEASYKVGSTYYFNVWSVDLVEYVEPQEAEVKSSLVLATHLYDAVSHDLIWAIDAKSKIVQDSGNASYYPYIVAEAEAIVSQMSEVGLITQ